MTDGKAAERDEERQRERKNGKSEKQVCGEKHRNGYRVKEERKKCDLRSMELKNTHTIGDKIRDGI